MSRHRTRTTLSPADERAFQAWYQGWAQAIGIDPDPDHLEHRYDYRGAWKAGRGPSIDPSDGRYHWPSEFKDDDHPNRFVGGRDTKASGASAPPASPAAPSSPSMATPLPHASELPGQYPGRLPLRLDPIDELESQSGLGQELTAPPFTPRDFAPQPSPGPGRPNIPVGAAPPSMAQGAGFQRRVVPLADFLREQMESGISR